MGDAGAEVSVDVEKRIKGGLPRFSDSDMKLVCKVWLLVEPVDSVEGASTNL